MKKIALYLLLSGFLLNASAQTKSAKKKSATKRTVAAKKTPSNNQSSTVVLTDSSSQKAYAPSTSATRFSIADPTVNALNQKANGAPIQLSSSGVVGMPKGSYGFANGKILLRATSASSPGTQYGSGSVATGTSLLGTGSGENTLGANGKSPYAGPWLWGDKQPIYKGVSLSDSSKRQ